MGVVHRHLCRPNTHIHKVILLQVLFSVYECVACMHVCASHAPQCPRRSEEGAGFPGASALDSCEPLYVLGTKPGSSARAASILPC